MTRAKPAPVTVTPVMLRLANPVLVTITLCCGDVVLTTMEPKFTDAGRESDRGAATARPVPVNAMVCGLPGALLAMVSARQRRKPSVA